MHDGEPVLQKNENHIRIPSLYNTSMGSQTLVDWIVINTTTNLFALC